MWLVKVFDVTLGQPMRPDERRRLRRSELVVDGEGLSIRVHAMPIKVETLLDIAAGHLGRHVSIPTSFAVVYGQNLSDARPLPEIPP